MSNLRQIVVIGGGASGIMAAIAAAHTGAKVTLVEKHERIGRSILVSGNGRCNLSNTALDSAEASSFYNNPEFVSPLLQYNGCAALRQLLKQFGLLTFADQAGRVYPQTNRASTVLEVLQGQLAILDVEVLTGFEVVGVQRNAAGLFDILTANGVGFSADKVIIACGHGELLRAVAGHRFVKQVPVLGPLATNTEPLRGLDGVRVFCAATLYRTDGTNPNDRELLSQQSGELLFRKYGVSGIMIFDLSRYAVVGDTLAINFLEDYLPAELLDLLHLRLADLAGYDAQQFLTGIVHSRLVMAILRALKIDPRAKIKAGDLERLALTLQNFELMVAQGPSAKQSQVMRGGLDTDQFDPNSLESKLTPGLFACGEALDIDAACGGFNLHWAWTSGWQAGSRAGTTGTGKMAGRALVKRPSSTRTLCKGAC